jgi:hypothetical protein
MARQVRKKMGWDEGSDNRIANRTGLLGFIDNILGFNNRVHEPSSSTTYGRVEGFRAPLGFASVREAEALLRRARMLQ